MSNTYQDLENNFPDSIDNFDKFRDPDIASIPLINQYYTYINQGDLINAFAILTANPSLKPMVINADNMNQLRDGLISVERYYLNDVQQYLVNIVKYKNEWSSTTGYTKYDVVTYTTSPNSSEVYMGIVENIPLGTVPTNTAYWVPLVIKGDQGEAGLGLSFQGQYNNVTSYPANVAVEYQGSLYGSLQATQGNPPTAGGSNAYWALAWNYQIPNNSVSYAMLTQSLQSTIDDKQDEITSSTNLTVNNLTATTLTGGLTYTTTAPTENNIDGIKICVLSDEPATKYDGWLYVITD